MTEAAAGRLRVAVALTTCDSEEFLEPMLESLACQSRAPDVLIVGDDLSTDRTPEILERFTRRVSFPVVVIRHRERLGLHRNTASILERSRHLAEVVALADHDDVWAADKLAAVEAAFAQTLPPALWFSDAELIDELGEPLSMRLFDKVHLSVDDCAQLRRGGGLRRLVHGQTVTSPTMAFAAEIIPHCLPFPEDVILGDRAFQQDGWIAVLARVWGDFAVDDRPLIAYRQHARQMSHRERVESSSRDPGSRRAVLEREQRRVRLVADRVRRDDATWARDRREEILALDQFLSARTHRGGLAARVRVIGRELGAGSYHRFAQGTRTALYDLARTLRQQDHRLS